MTDMMSFILNCGHSYLTTCHQIGPLTLRHRLIIAMLISNKSSANTVHADVLDPRNILLRKKSTRKLQAGRRLHHLRRLQARELLARTFASWKTPQAEVPGEVFGISLLCAQVKNGVQYQLANCALRHDLRRARGQALKEAITSLPEDCHASVILQKLKPIVGPTNLRHKMETPLPIVHDEEGRPCSTPQALIDRWMSFFGAMEGGSRMEATQLQQLWQQNLRAFIPDQLCLQPEDVPTLVELERVFRRVKAGKAIGADNIPPELWTTGQAHYHTDAQAGGTWPRSIASQRRTLSLSLEAEGSST